MNHIYSGSWRAIDEGIYHGEGAGERRDRPPRHPRRDLGSEPRCSVSARAHGAEHGHGVGVVVAQDVAVNVEGGANGRVAHHPSRSSVVAACDTHGSDYAVAGTLSRLDQPALGGGMPWAY